MIKIITILILSLSSPYPLKVEINRIATLHDTDPALIEAIIYVESSWNPNARSRKNAKGLMQLMPSTCRRFGVKNPYNPVENVIAGVKWFSYLQKRYKNKNLALAAYNAGPGNVDKFNGIPPFRETRQYIEKVNKRYAQLKK